MNVFDLMAKISLDKSEYESGLNDASEKTSSFADKLKGGLATAGKVGAAAIGAVTSAATAVGGAVIKGASDVAAYGDNIDKMSQKLGMSAEAYQEWDAVMQHSGTSIDSMQASMKTLSNAAAEGSKSAVAAFERLGISIEDAAAMSQEDLFSTVITQLQGMEEGSERTAVAADLLGKAATELGPLLNTSAADTQAMKDRVHELGGVMSNEAVKAAAGFQDSLQDMQTSIAGVKNNLMSDFLPSITQVMDGVTEAMSGGGFEKLSEGIDSFISNLTSKLPDILSAGGEIVISLAEAITNNLPKIAEAGIDICVELANGIIQSLPQLAETAFSLVESFADDLVEQLPQLIESGVTMILQLVDTLTDPDNLDKLVDAALKIAVALAEGIIKAAPRLIAAIQKISENLLEALARATPKILDAAVEIGGAIIEGIWSGISDAADWLWEQISGFFEWLIGGIKDLLGIASPSKLFAGIGGNMAKGIGVGFDKEFKDVSKDINSNLDFGTATIDYQASGVGRAAAQTGAQAFQAASAQDINIPITLTIDGAVLARTQYRYNQREKTLHGASLVRGTI